MRKALLALLLSSVLMVLSASACSDPSLTQTDQSRGDSVNIVFGGDGEISSDSSEVVVNNYREGGRASIVYRVHNDTEEAVTPEIYVVKYAKVEDYSKATGFESFDASDYVSVSAIKSIPAGGEEEFTVTFETPEDIKLPSKFGFQVGATPQSSSYVQTAVAVWWLITMR